MKNKKEKSKGIVFIKGKEKLAKEKGSPRKLQLGCFHNQVKHNIIQVLGPHNIALLNIILHEVQRQLSQILA